MGTIFVIFNFQIEIECVVSFMIHHFKEGSTSITWLYPVPVQDFLIKLDDNCIFVTIWKMNIIKVK